MSIILRKDPIVEAVCDFHFESEKWDWTVPGLIYKRIKDDFPQSQEQPHVQFEVQQTPSGVTANAGSSLGRMQFWRADRTALVQVGPNHLSINQLRPYIGWPQFKAMIEQVLSLYKEESPFEKINGLSLRYINHLPLPEGRYHFEELINTYPRVPGQDKQTWATWVQRVDIVREELKALFTVQAGCVPIAPQPALEEPLVAQPSINLMLMLDLVFRHAVQEPMPLESVSSWLDTAHAEIEAMFFQSVQPEYLKTFEPEGNHENIS